MADRFKPVAQLRVDLGVARSYPRPHVSTDTPYSEAQYAPPKPIHRFQASLDGMSPGRPRPLLATPGRSIR